MWETNPWSHVKAKKTIMFFVQNMQSLSSCGRRRRRRRRSNPSLFLSHGGTKKNNNEPSFFSFTWKQSIFLSRLGKQVLCFIMWQAKTKKKKK